MGFRLRLPLGLGLAASAAACASVQGARPAAIHATVDHSEWTPAGDVRLDLVNGRYEYKPGRPRFGPAEPVRHGTLSAAQLEQVRASYQAARSAGLKKQPCMIVVGSSGQRIMLLHAPGGTLAAPWDIGCWSDSALALHSMLESLFR